MSEKGTIWEGLMQERYGELNTRLWLHDDYGYNPKDSNWWRDIMLIGANPMGLMEKIIVKLGDGGKTLFWKSRWLGNRALADQFPGLYAEISNKFDTVSSMGNWNNNVWSWNIIQSEEVLGLEATGEYSDLVQVLLGIQPRQNIIDLVVWPFENSRVFTVKSCYRLLMQVQGEADLEDSQKCALKIIWGSRCPSKIKIFGWRLILDRLPTRKQLMRRRIITQPQEVTCAFCGQGEEEIAHIMLYCPKLKLLWLKIQGWLDIQIPYVENCSSHLIKSVEELGRSMSNKRAGVVWLTACWCIWNHKNNIVFNSAELDIDEIFLKTLWFSWWWLAIGAKDRILFGVHLAMVDCMIKTEISCNFFIWDYELDEIEWKCGIKTIDSSLVVDCNKGEDMIGYMKDFGKEFIKEFGKEYA
ncbi:uncharacterized protein LOC131657957 [Vicia villosa]|uniref:uncharacterized protein LOC131657957 n=1 Tax=Vicia villosa TaxID=3911 RepID=UPI00273BE47B|nr:uncharacterized protein LOC131657957 [Vicia villosa]